MNLGQIRKLAAKGESDTVELKKSTAQLGPAGKTLCAFLNMHGGQVLIGVTSEGEVVGQQISDKTLRDVAAMLDRFDPPAPVEIERVRMKGGHEVIVLSAAAASDDLPFTFDGRAYQRIATTTSVMPRERYERLLLERPNARRRWENQEAEGTSVRDINRQEVFRALDAARAAGRLVEPVGRDLGRVLDRLKVRRDGTVLRAAVVLFGKRFLPDFPQCELRMARFLGTDKTEFLDQRQLRGPGLKLLEEALLFAQRHFPLPGRIEPGRLERVDRPLIPPDALREIIVNALIHRDYTIAGGAISLAIFDDRVEVWSAGRFPAGITAADLSREHDSFQRNPIIAEVFHLAGLIEKWGRGTNRVISMCRDAGIAPPGFREAGGSVVVTFKVRVAVTPHVTPHVTPQVTPHVTPQVAAILEASRSPRTRGELQEAAGLRDREHLRKRYLEPLLTAGWLEMTIPDKPRSRLQRYRATMAGLAAVEEQEGGK